MEGSDTPADDMPQPWEIAVVTRPRSVSVEVRGTVPALVQRAGARAAERFLEFFTATIWNKNTRAAYARAVRLFFDWLDERGLDELGRITPMVVGAYIENHTFRATGITNYLSEGGVVETAQEMAGHESSRTTGLYDRREGKVTRTEVERISI